MAEDVYIIGAAMTRFRKFPDKRVKVLTGEALELVLGDSGPERKDIEVEKMYDENFNSLSEQGGLL